MTAKETTQLCSWFMTCTHTHTHKYMPADMHVNIFACICVFKMNFLCLYFVTLCNCICFFSFNCLCMQNAKLQVRSVNYYGLACTLLWIRLRIYPHSLYICLSLSPIWMTFPRNLATMCYKLNKK